MKRVIIGMILAAAASLSYAHGGGTDAAGCHMNHKTGVYHCH